MVFSFKQNYDMQIEHCGQQGSKITFRRNTSWTTMSVCIVLCAVGFWKCSQFSHNSKFQNIMSVGLILMAFAILVLQLKKIHTESLLLMSSIGVTVQRSCLLGTTSRFFDIQQIDDIVILEAITMHKVIFELVLLPNMELRTNGSIANNETFPLFLDFRPKLTDLKLVYREAQEKLFSRRARPR